MSLDVFISYNSRDVVKARSLATILRRRGLSVWFDEWVLGPGTDFVDEIEKAIKSAASVGVVIGKSGGGPWQREEVKAFIVRMVKKENFPVVPILVDGATTDDVHSLLQAKIHLDCNDGFTPKPIEKLVLRPDYNDG